MVLEFPIASQGVLVDLILRSRALYLLAGQRGDRWLTTRDRPRLFIEAPNTGFEAMWDKLFLKHVTMDLRTRSMNRSDAKTAASNYPTQLRRLSAGRMRS